MPRTYALITAEFATIRPRLRNLGARIIETASRVRIDFAAAHPEVGLIGRLASAIRPARP